MGAPRVTLSSPMRTDVRNQIPLRPEAIYGGMRAPASDGSRRHVGTPFMNDSLEVEVLFTS